MLRSFSRLFNRSTVSKRAWSSVSKSRTETGALRRHSGTWFVLGLGIGAAGFATSYQYFWSQRYHAKPDVDDLVRWRPREGHVGQLRKDRYASKQTMLQAVDEIRAALGSDKVSMDKDDIEDHGWKETSASNTTERPVAIVRPVSTDQVSQIAQICSRHRVPMVPYGAGSSVEGSFSSPFSGICIDFSEMNEIIAFHPDDMDVVVQPGVNWTVLNDQIRESGLFLPLDPGPTALIGGMVSTNCSGTNATRYGSMKDYVVNMTVVLADGTVAKTRHRPRKTSAGYNLNSLFVGSEGTLGMITEITLKLAIIPESVSVATASFTSVKDAADAATVMMRRGVRLAAIELMDDSQMKVINKNGGAGGRLWEEETTLFLKFAGSPASIVEDSRSAEDAAKANHCTSFRTAKTDAEVESLWSARKTALTASLAVRPEGTQMWSSDIAVPLSHMAHLIDVSKEKASKLSLFNSILGHVGDGNFHQLFMYDPNDPAATKAVADLLSAQIDEAIRLEGTVSGEHGVGTGKKHALFKELGPSTIGIMKAIKDALDPHWLLNPGKVFDE